MSRARRLLLAGVGAAAGHWVFALMLLVALQAGPTALWIALSGALLAVVTIVGYRAAVGPGPDDDERDSPSPDDPEPPWWPEFEREFRDYDRRRRQPV